jgi:hypothetical protein
MVPLPPLGMANAHHYHHHADGCTPLPPRSSMQPFVGLDGAVGESTPPPGVELALKNAHDDQRQGQQKAGGTRGYHRRGQ